ncbi:hypothetical protein H6G41_33735 [Tolypothrix sp. FACHB-123]|uniref:hypothetical protein n=1 Tax=Tolypothrix sp. FACHB-123 TaxID=2692868 RepID=UPI0016862A21|nr:hypothetical protein [Tolypothrix sp. FACHB-123]MBD2359475.1 hypothetical protein [Tolypothrix sp. FACHB-123]
MTYSTNTQQALSNFNCNTPDEQALAQAELYNHLEAQAEAVAPEQLTTVEINSYHYEVYALKQLIAYISYDYDEFVTQPWVVMTSGEEKFRHTTIAQCQRYIEWHYKDGTLKPAIPSEIREVPKISEISFYDQEALIDGELVASISYDSDNREDLYWRVLVNNIEIFRDTTPARCHSYIKQQYQQGTLPVEEPFVEPCTTGNKIMAQIANECEKHGLELLDDGIYRNEVKLGQAGCTEGNWWFVRASELQVQVTCDSVIDAVLCLSIADTVPDAGVIDCEQLLDLPFDQLTTVQWRQLLEYKAEKEELVAA